jgi:hypothetical protein
LIDRKRTHTAAKTRQSSWVVGARIKLQNEQEFIERGQAKEEEKGVRIVNGALASC